MKYLINFIEEIISEPNKEYDSAHSLIIEDIIEILEEQIATNRLLNIHHTMGALIIDLKTYVDGSELILSIFHDKKTLSFDVLYEGEYYTILDLNKPEFKNEENDSYYVIDNLVQQIVGSLW